MANPLLSAADAVELQRRVARAEELRDQAYATAADRTRERDDSQRERDIAARMLLSAYRERDLARRCFMEADASLTAALDSLDRIRIAAGVPVSYEADDYEAAIIARLSGGATP